MGLEPVLERVSGELQAEGAEMVVWGETAFPYMAFDRASVRDLPTRSPIAVRKKFNIPILFGAITADRTGDNPYPWNTAFGMNAEGEFVGRYDKNYPLIFGEYVPLVDPDWFTELIPSASHLNRGDGPEIIVINGQSIGPTICYEDLLPYFVRDISNAGASVLINLTNDSWFGKSWEQPEHLGLAVFRAVEHRRGLVRTVNAGISAYIDPTGRVVEQTEVTDSDTEGYGKAVGFVADVPMVDPAYTTVFGYTGRLFGWLCVFGVVALAVSLNMAFGKQSWRLGEQLPREPFRGLMGLVIGGFSSMMGIGGGTLSVPIMTLYNVPVHRAVGTASAIGLIIAIPGAISFVVSGWGAEGLPPFSLGHVSLLGFALIVPMTILSAPWGAKLAHALPVVWLKRAFAVFLALTGMRMLGLFG